MTSHPQTPAFRTLRLGLLLATVGSLVAVAAPASALPGLAMALPSVDQRIETPAGSIDAHASDQGAAFCSDVYTPTLPAVPALPAVPSLPVPVAVPAIPAPSTSSIYAAADSCASAGLDGASITADVEAAGAHAGTGIAAESPVSQKQVEATVDETTGQAKGFFEGLLDTLFGWM
jgi:hypothetical protein